MTGETDDTAPAPFLTAWFELMDSDHPERVLDLISADFAFSVLFSTGAEAATDFAGGRAAMEHYLAQREKGAFTHHLITASTNGPDELFLGETRRDGQVVSTFVAAARINADGLAERMLMARSPAVRFGEQRSGEQPS
ncbi:hypothetical protein [Saccharothrix deserti]|uniref:hypothetical protein n=1 Tax=Saccharothrix deserti TaxID=2593674 RepID=UPI00131AD742|nr:hypothetical protein [Saccharothrix deserti]